MTETFDFKSLDGFDWDHVKNEANRAKHGIDFDDAIEIF
ncbi:BrnT family toxin [Rhodopseudomonas sp. P2A-2r]|nr:BrnT family toxin [Rhodopseudomonas sp. P2A-2r]UZE48765.1 BrnT family toxin [Rhodopseudomonas sp. P2A-2r]